MDKTQEEIAAELTKEHGRLDFVEEFGFNLYGICINPRMVRQKSFGTLLWMVSIAKISPLGKRKEHSWDYHIEWKCDDETGDLGIHQASTFSYGYRTELEACIAGARIILGKFKEAFEHNPSLKKCAPELNSLKYFLSQWETELKDLKTKKMPRKKKSEIIDQTAATLRKCRVCGCTDDDCHQCIEKTGHPCHWVEDDLCSSCKEEIVSMSKPSTEFKMISIDLISPDKKQPRKFFDQQAQDELTESIRANGILQPILVRPDDTEEERYLLVCGERRLRSAKEVGVTKVPAVIRQMGNTEALELQITENLQRKDVHPMEEAAGFRSLYDNEAFSIEEIAGRIGKSQAYVAQRLKLNDLIDDFQEMFFRDLLTLTEANKLARVASESQQSILREILRNELRNKRKDWREEEGFSTGNIDWYLKKESHNLNKANFKLSDAKLYPEAGPCTKCPHNSANSPLLFPDIEKGKYCSNGICFNIKTQRSYRQSIEKYAADPDIVFVQGRYCYSDEDEQKVATAEEMGLKVFDNKKIEYVTEPGTPMTESEYVELVYEDHMPWEETEDEKEEQKAIEEAKKVARAEYNEYLREQKEAAEEYTRKKAEGLIRKAYVVAGDDSGKLVDIEIKGSAKKETLDDVLSIDEEIARIKAKEDRNKELDREKIFTEVMAGIIDHPNWTGKLTDDEEIATIILLYESGGYEPGKWLERQLDLPSGGGYDYSRIKLFRKLCLVKKEQTKLDDLYAGMVRRSLHSRLVVKDGGDYQNYGKAAAMMGIAQWFVSALVDQVNVDQSARIEKRQANVKKRLDALKKKKVKLKKEK